jgi:hypothetical protein
MPKVRRMTTGPRTHPFAAWLRPARSLALEACALSVAAAALALPAGEADARARHASAEPVVVELYTAQGCATCPQANGVVSDLAAKKGVLPLTFSVDYWDYLGWEDTLAKPEFSARQRAYVERLKVREIYTPEIVVGGAAEGPALEHKKINDLITEIEAQHHRGPRLKLMRHDSRVRVSGAGAGDVWLVRYDPQPQSIKIKTGENKSQTVVVRNAVRELKRLGSWRGAAKVYPVPTAEDDGLKTVVIVQAPKGGRILGAVKG